MWLVVDYNIQPCYQILPPGCIYLGYVKDLWHGFPNRLAYWHLIMVCGVKQHNTEVMPALDYSELLHRCNGVWKNYPSFSTVETNCFCPKISRIFLSWDLQAVSITFAWCRWRLLGLELLALHGVTSMIWFIRAIYKTSLSKNITQQGTGSNY